jgi:2-methylcitrate dehydratase PrpD
MANAKIIDQLVEYMLSARDMPLPEEVVQRAKNHLLDTLAAIVSGSELRPGALAIQFARSQGGIQEASVLGSNLVTSALWAAFANGISAHSDESDDSNDRLHPGCSVVPAAWAVAEREKNSGKALLNAVVLGYDIASRFNKALIAKSTSVAGTFGAAAAAGSLLELDAAQARYLLSYAAQQASGSTAWIGDDEHIEKAFDFGGIPGRNGVTAALLVKAGFTGNADVFAGDRNYLDEQSPPPDSTALVSELGTRYEITRGLIKKYPTGAPMQEAVEAMVRLVTRHGIKAADVAKVVVRLPERGAQTVNNRHMPDVNVQYIMSVVLLDGRLTFAAAHDYARMQDKRVPDLRARVQLMADEAMTRSPQRYQARVEVTLSQGQRYEEHVIDVRGRPQNPMTAAEVQDKALELMTPVLGSERVGRLFDVILNLESVADINELRPILIKL